MSGRSSGTASRSGRGGRARGSSGRGRGRQSNSGRGGGRSGGRGRSQSTRSNKSSFNPSQRAGSSAHGQTTQNEPSDLSATAVPFQPGPSENPPPTDRNAKSNKKGGKKQQAGNANTSQQGNKKPKAKQQEKQSKGKPDSKQPKANSQPDKSSKNKPNNKQKNDNAKSRKKTKGKPSTSSKLIPSTPPNQPQTTNDLNYARGESIKVLHIAEKPSIAQAIAKGLAGGSSFKSKGSRLPVHEFSDPNFPKAPHASKCLHRVTSVAGHVFSVDFPSQYQSWDAVDPAELFHAPIVKKPNQGSVVKHLQEEARGVNFIVLWNDCDREGENINFEVLDCCMHLMKAGGASNYDRVYRAYFSAINPSDIKKAYTALGKPDKNQSLSVDARQELDLKVGVAFSRFQTRFFQGRYGDLDSAVLSYGPCQTPTLGFCVQRHVDIETFKPEPYWSLDLGVLKRGRMFRATWGSGRSFNQKKLQGLVDKCIEASPPCTVKVASVVTKDKKQGRPVPLNTVNMLKACSKALGIGPHSAMQAAERLYLSGYLSYPRTESTAYPKSFDVKAALQAQTGDNRWGKYVRDLLRDGHNKSRGGVDMGDHPPITPCRSAGPSELSGDTARIYDLVVRHFIASVSQDAVWRSTRVDFDIDTINEHGHFTISGKEIVSPGFLAVVLHKEYGDDAENEKADEEEERSIPEFVKGEVIPIFRNSASSSSKVAVTSGAPCWASLDVKERMTTPPSHLTESELIGKMEKNGIGTDASIATHIENVLKRNYVHLESGRKLIPSKLGLVLCQGYHQIDASLVLPQVRSDIEDQCSRIAKGLASREDVVKRALEIFEGKFDFFVKHIDRMDVLFGSSFAKLEDVGKPFTRCGLTRRYLQYITGPPQRLYNKYTETVYPLPGGGIIKQWTGRKCSVERCNFELCLYSVGQPERTFPLCPNCFNNPRPEWGRVPGDDDSRATPKLDSQDETKERQIRRVGGKSLILECPLPDRHPLISDMTVSPDPDSDGVFVLDPHFGPKWRLVSTRSPTIVHLPKNVDKVTILSRKDEVLGVKLMQIDFKSGESPLPNGETKHGPLCFPKDELIQGLVRVYHGSERTKASGRGGRGRGRGRKGGRGGRGRR